MKRVLAFLVTLAPPTAALAAAVEEHSEARGVPWTKLALSTINLCIFLYIVRRTAWPTLRNWVAERRATIAGSLAQAERAKRDAEALRAEWQRRLDRLGSELESMLQQARADIAIERDQILAGARTTAEAIQRDARRTAASEIRSAQEALRAELAAHALAVAERLAPQQLTPADQQRFVGEFVERIEQR
jgi:F-type H+-transporting ATPase subunit b